MSIEGWQEAVVFLGALLGALVALVGITKRWLVDPIARSLRETMRDELRPLAAQVERIAYEVQYDSGESLKDKVRDLTGEVAQLRGEVNTVLRFVDPQRPNPTEDNP